MATSSSSSSPSSSKGWLSNLSTTASRIYFFLIILQIPLFRLSGFIYMFQHFNLKALLYPGAVANGIVKNMTVPSWDSLLNIYNLTSVKEAPAVTDLQRLEVLAGSYFSVAGALVGLLKPGRMSMFGTLLIIWGLVKEGILGKPVNTDPTKAVYVYPTMLIALICAFSSVKYDVKKIVRSAPARPIAKPVQRSSKSKLK
ncbi:hypothetical protein FNV43_RR12319 [Rhamnella rubrinervis]|uniref:Uncharacterized protein n=1 Tax=Rhamnella rubrinervis TaxID=2594499 RepID=A0A8K0MI60_9ROSA|nr:hypothetical protein FNV43_RR12319 [Rhamnella rubrinervis]